MQGQAGTCETSLDAVASVAQHRLSGLCGHSQLCSAAAATGASALRAREARIVPAERSVARRGLQTACVSIGLQAGNNSETQRLLREGAPLAALLPERLAAHVVMNIETCSCSMLVC